jgi:4'-phosphopantetheinyl transferase
VHVWSASLALDAAAREALAEPLSEEERTRAARFRSQLHHDRFVAGRGIQRALLARYLGCAPREIAYQAGAQGKPLLRGDRGELRFNLSNSEDGLLLAVALRRELGVDLEAVRPVTERDAIARRFFSPAENLVFDTLPEAERDAAFYTCWTRKEAYLKGLGGGLTLPLDSFDVTLVPGGRARLLRPGVHAGETRWTLRALEPGPGWIAALAVEGGPFTLRRFSWDE